jgi:hypothetical protein
MAACGPVRSLADRVVPLESDAAGEYGAHLWIHVIHPFD